MNSNLVQHREDIHVDLGTDTEKTLKQKSLSLRDDFSIKKKKTLLKIKATGCDNGWCAHQIL